MDNPIILIAVIGFHHKKGCQVEYCYPSFGESNSDIPEPWQNLPSLALPDGAHNTAEDVIYFLLPSLENPNNSVFGISCYRQIAAQELLSKSDEVTRSTVQKSVCVISVIPLFGVLKAKLELITQAYFNERDFAKVEVLCQMYNNLSDMFSGYVYDDNSATMDISVRSLVTCFKHRLLVLFKLLLLERKVVFYIFPVSKLGDMMVALISLFPRLLEEGLFHAASYSASLASSSSCNWNRGKIGIENKSILFGVKNGISCSPVVSNQSPSTVSSENDNDALSQKNSHKPVILDAQRDRKFIEGTESCCDTAENDRLSTTLLARSYCSSIDTDSFGFPLSIFTKGSLFHPYLSISYLDMIRAESTRAYCIGSTNALFIQRRDLVDVIVTVNEGGEGVLDIVNPELRRALSLTAADLRFMDYILKEVTAGKDSAAWEGGDDWVRLQTRAYILSLMATVRADLKEPLNSFNEIFVEQWKLTNNYRVWSSGQNPDLAGAVPGHPFAGGLGVTDVLLRVEHSVGGSGGGRKIMSAVSSTGSFLSDAGQKVRSNISAWFLGNNSSS